MRLTGYILIVLLSALRLQAQTFNGTGGSLPGSSTVQTCFPINVTGVGNINDINNGLATVCINITHPFVDELEILLRAPDGTTVPLSIQNGGAGDNYTNTCFSNSATTSIKFGNAPFTGTFIPEGYLGSVNNGQNANGTWRICIQDRRTAANAGTLNSWSITFNNNPAPLPPEFPACTSTLPSTSSCASATAVCDFNGLCGSTAGSSVQTWPGSGLAGCFGLQNNSFIKFIASDITAAFTVWVPTSSAGPSGGIQMLFFSGTCDAGPVTTHGCYPHIFPYPNASTPLPTIITATGLVPGNTYYLMFDGFNNDICTFRIAANTGVTIVNVNPSAPAICNGQSVNLTASGSTNPYNWSPATGLNTTSGATVTASPAVTTIYTVNTTTATGCVINQNVTVTVNDTPTITLQPSPVIQQICQNGPVSTLSVTANPGSGTITGYQWFISTTNSNTGGTAIPFANGPSYTPSSANVGTLYFYCRVTNSNGCSTVSAVSGALIVSPLVTTPTASVTVQPTCTSPAGTIVVTAPAGANIEYSSGGAYQTSGTFTGLAPGSYNITARNTATGCTSAVRVLTVNPLPPGPPAPTGSVTAQPTCNTPTGTVVITAPAGPNFEYSNGGAYQASGSFTGLTNGTTYSFTVRDISSGCISSPLSLSIDPISGAPAQATVTITQPDCASGNLTGSLTVTAPAGADFEYSINSTVYQSGTSFTGLAAGSSYALTVRQISTGCVSAPLNVSINALALPNPPAVSSPVTYCEGASVSALTATGSNLLWYSTQTGGTGSSTAPVPATTAAGSTDYFVSQTIGACESDRSVITVTINPSPTPPVVVSPVIYCQQDIATPLSATGTDLLWYSSATGGPGSNTAPTPVTAGAGSVIYYVSQTVNGCESPRAAITVTVNPTPSEPVAQPVNYCLNAAAAPLSATGNNLLWYNSSTGGFGNSTAPTPTTDVAGDQFFYVSQTVNGCESDRALMTVTVSALPPAPMVNSPVGYCQNAAATSLTATGSNLLWYSTQTGGTGSSTAPVPATTAVGSQDYYVSQTVGGCESARERITVNIGSLPPVPAVITPVEYCEQETAMPLSATGTGLLWYTVASGGTGSSAAPVPVTSTAGSQTFFVSQTISGCEGPRAPVTVTIKPTPAEPQVITPVTYCLQVVAAPLTATGSNLLWYAAVTGGSGSGTAPIPSTSTAGSQSYFVSQTLNGCESGRAAITVTVNPIPSAPGVSSPVTYCQGTATLPLSATGSSLLWYTAASGGTGTPQAPVPASTGPGSTDYFVSQTVDGCESPRSVITVTVNASPEPPAVVTPVFYCQNSTAGPLSATGTGLLWYTDATGTGGSTTAPVPPTVNTGTTFYYVSQTINGCESQRRAITVTVSASSTAVTGFSFTPAEVCMNSVNPAPAYDLGFTTGGQFTSIPAGLAIDEATGIVNLSASSPGTYQITYQFQAAGCIAGNSSSATLTLLPAVATVTVFSYNSPVCKDAGVALPNLANGFTLGGSFTSTPGLSIDNSSGIINIAASSPGTYQITYRLPEFGCRLGTNNFSFITINDTSSPVTGFTYDITDICISTGINPVIRRQPGFTSGGLFSVTPAGLNMDDASGNINIGLSVPGIYTIRYDIPASGCRYAGSDSVLFIVRAFGNPVTGFSYFSPVCSGDDSATVVPVPGFTTGGLFSAPPGVIIHPATGVIDLVNSDPGIYNITYEVGAGVCNPAGSGSSSIQILELPAPPVGAGAGICGAGSITLQASALGTISWYNEPGLLNQVNVGSSFTTFLSNTRSYFITNTVGTCESRPVEIVATVSPVPAVPQLGNDTAICPNDRIVLNPGNYNQYLWQDGSTAGSYTVTQPGSYRVVVSTGPGCSDSTDIRISFLDNCDDLLFPNAFAPDGRNRSFAALGNYSLVSRYALRIFNRYGEEVFASADPAARWDGTYKGKPVNSGVYVWVATYIYRNRIQKTQKGTVMVIR